MVVHEEYDLDGVYYKKTFVYIINPFFKLTPPRCIMTFNFKMFGHFFNVVHLIGF